MKKIKYNILIGLLVVFQLNTLNGFAQNQPIQLNTTPITTSCNMGNLGVANISVPTEVLSGDNIPLNITLPGTMSQNCTKTVTITSTSNLQFVNSGSIPFILNGSSYTNAQVLPGNDGQNFNVFFKFPGGVTCNNEIGTFTVTVTANCNGVETSCTSTVTVKARAENYWTITKQYVAGNMVCGTSQWKFLVSHNNPNGQGLGAYDINGSITESPSLNVISGVSHNINQSYLSNGGSQYFSVLRNCYPEGSVITNSATYAFNLGNGCDTMNGTVTATSPPLISPNTSVQFTKTAFDNNNFYNGHPSFNPTQGCEGRYTIQIHNNGNVCLTDLNVTDNLSIPGINITSITLPSGWTSTPATPPFTGLHTFSSPPGFLLNPNAYTSINIYYTVTAAVSSTITNTAQLSYQTINCTPLPDPSNPQVDPCPGINCPVISDTIQNTSATNSFVVKAMKSHPKIKKGILSPPNNANPPIYQIGNTIKFRIQVSNSGSDVLNTIVSDGLGVPGQNLEIIPSTISLTYFPNENNYNYMFTPIGLGITSLPFSVVQNISNLQNPIWTISNMPGICVINKANYLFIEFEAMIKPQTSGSKTNTASLTNGSQSISSSVNYTIDQVGILGIHKTADTQFAESGQAYNYIITVSNNGSVPLNNIIVTDNLPNCSEINGPISVKKGNATIGFTGSSNPTINITPSASINPGESFVITIPVVKTGSGTCCNETVSATALMTNSQQLLSANFGNQDEPAVCVASVSCCDIPDLNVSLKQTFNGDSFYLSINAGSTPIQSVEVSMVDYHVEYENNLCKPANMGIFGNISSPNAVFNGLLIDGNNSQVVSWLPGNPAVLNGNIKLNISKPGILNLPCCNGKMYFCLKVKITDVNCNVCEKIVCGSISLNPKKLTPFPNDPKVKFLKDIKIRPELKNQYEKMKNEEPIIEYYQLNENKEENKENQSKI